MTLPLREARERFERTYLKAQLERFGGNVSRTAQFVGMERSALHRKLKLLGHDHVGVTTVCPSYVATGMFEGVKPPLLTRFLTPERLAKKIVDAMKNDQVFVLEPWMVKVTPLLMGALPARATDFLADFLGASSSMTEWRGH